MFWSVLGALLVVFVVLPLVALGVAYVGSSIIGWLGEDHRWWRTRLVVRK